MLSQSWVALSGVVLIVAACVQFYFLASEADGNITQEQGGKLLLGCVETSLGLWAVSGLWPVRACSACLIWFVGCLCWSGRQWLLGAASCGCAGRFIVPPMISFGVALVLVIGLVLGRSAFASARQAIDSEAARIRRVLCGLGQAAVLIYAGAFLFLGSPRWVLAYFEAAPVVIVPSRIEVGECQFGSEREVELTLKNVTSRQVRIQGIQTTCACTTVADPPEELLPGAVSVVRLKIRCVGAPHVPFHQTIRVYAVDGGLHTIPVEVFATLTGPFPKPHE